MANKQVTVATIKEMKQKGEPITMITAYDVAMSRNVNEAGVDMILVGDSLGNVILGYNSTVPVTMDEMIHHTKAVMRGNSTALVVGDMPFMSYQASIVDAMYNAARFLKETGCTAVKLEGGSEVVPLVERLTQAGIPVCAHIGLTPQSVNQLGGFKVQGKDIAAAQKMIDDAKALEAAGAFACVLECVPAALAAKVTAELKTMATIGIGAGNGCDGQVLVVQDMLQMTPGGFKPKMVRQFAQIGDAIVDAFHASEMDRIDHIGRYFHARRRVLVAYVTPQLDAGSGLRRIGIGAVGDLDSRAGRGLVLFLAQRILLLIGARRDGNLGPGRQDALQRIEGEGLAVLLDLLELGFDLPIRLTIKRKLLKRAGLLEHREFVGVKHVIHTLSHSSSLFP